MYSDRTPFFGGYFPVAAAVHTDSACVGRSVARSSTAPRSNNVPKFGSWPAATRCKHEPAGRAVEQEQTHARRLRHRDRAWLERRAAGTGTSPGPRIQSGTITDAETDAIISTAAGRLPLRPNEYRSTATPTSTAAQIVVATAPWRM